MKSIMLISLLLWGTLAFAGVQQIQVCTPEEGCRMITIITPDIYPRGDAV